MLKKSLTLLLVSTALTAGAAMAQTGSTSSSGSTASSPAGKFITEQTNGEFRASKFVGLNVYGADNQKIGDVNEILIDRTGNAKAAVIGVGGFLGIGEKSVAVPFSSLEWVNTRPQATASNAGTPSNTASSGSSASGSTAGTAGTAASTSGPNTTASTSSGNRSPDDTAASNGYPDHAVLRMTKDDLQNAPTFKYFADARSGSGSNATSGGGSSGGMGGSSSSSSGSTAPRQ